MFSYNGFRFRIKYIIFLILLTFANSHAVSFSLNGQNEARYARGTQPDQPSGESYGYLENFLEMTANINSFRLYLRQGYRLPSEFGNQVAGINAFDKRYIEYRDDYFTVHGGDFYRTWGNGLLFANVEYLELNLDTGLEGILVEGSYNDFQAAAFRGVEVDTTGEFQEAAEGAYVSYTLPEFSLGWESPVYLRLGGIINRLDEGSRHPVIDRSGADAELNLGSISLYSAYVSDKVDFDETRYHHGFYGSSTFFGAGWGVLFEYKNYRLFTYQDDLVLQYPPTAFPETTTQLLDRHPKTPYLADDVGYQCEITFNLDEFSFLLNLNQSSEHDDNSLLPSFKEQFSPVQAAFLKIEHNPYDGNYKAIFGGWSEIVDFSPTPSGGYSEWYKRLAVGGRFDLPLSESITIEPDGEVMRVHNTGRDKTHWDEYFALTISHSPQFSLTAAIERSEDPSETGGLAWEAGTLGGEGHAWPSAELTMNVQQRHQARLFYGYERGGLRCSGGSCRWVNPFKGVKLTFISQF